MIWIIAKLIIGAATLTWSANRFITSSVAIAQKFKWPPLLIGMLLVGFGTSFPEMVVSAFASFQNKAPLAIGNAFGSNIINIALVLGLVALFKPFNVHSRLVKQELPLLLSIVVLVGLLLWNGYLTRIDGLILVAGLIAYLIYLFVFMPENGDALAQEFKVELAAKNHFSKSLIWWFISLVLLCASSEWFIEGATGIARWFHISELVIGLTLVALGTSLPELATTIAAMRHHQDDIAIGNIIGSNIFNCLAVLAMPALIAPGKLPPSLMKRDYVFMLLLTLALWLFVSIAQRKKIALRVMGLLLLLSLGIYLFVLVSA